MLNRRQFLRSGLRSAMGLGLASVVPLSVFSSMSASASEEYRAVICVLLAGGADSFNILVPRGGTQYSHYQNRRSDLALSQSSLLPLDGVNNGAQFGLHPAMTSLQQRFNAGQAAMIANVGPLVGPTNRASYEEGTAQLPLGLFSHSDQILSWQTAMPSTRSGTGFGGRLIDALAARNSGLTLAGNISLSGNNSFQAGSSSGAYSINAADGIRNISGYQDNAAFKQVVDQLLDGGESSRLQRVYADKIRSAIDTGDVFGAALAQATALTTPFAQDGFSTAMKRIAELISVREQLGVTRQTFFVTYGGWDHHEDTLAQQAQMLPALDAGLGQLMAATEELGVSSQVTTFTISDFGRTLTSNGKGSDHGWGGNAMMLGGAVRGARIYGEFPELVEDHPLDVGRGRFLPSTASDAMFAEIAGWMGVSGDALMQVLPNWSAFEGSPQGVGLQNLLYI